MAGRRMKKQMLVRLRFRRRKGRDMVQDVSFDYYYGLQAESYSFYRIPKVLMTDPFYKKLSAESKIVYGLMLNRMSLLIKNGWTDNLGRVYIVFTVEEMTEMMNCCRTSAIKMTSELEKIGLIEKKRVGQGKASIIYVKDFMSRKDLSRGIVSADKHEAGSEGKETDGAGENPEVNVPESQKSKKLTSRSKENGLLEVQKIDFKKSKKQTSRSPENRLLEVQKMDPSYTDYSKTDRSETESNLIYPENRMGFDRDRMDSYLMNSSLIKKNIEYGLLCMQYPKDEVDGIVSIMTGAVCTTKPFLVIGGDEVPAQLVKEELLKVTFEHVQYVFECLGRNGSQVRNIKQYLLTSLYNAPATIGHYYGAQVRYDMGAGASRFA